MKFSAAAVLAAAAGASAGYGGNATVVTEVVDVYTTYCPGPTQITHGSKTYTVTEATTLTITDCPCTITRPVIPTSSVVCNTCGGYNNGTAPGSAVPTAVPTGPSSVPGHSSPAPPAGGSSTKTGTGSPSAVPTAGAGKLAALSGAGLAGVVGFAAFVL